MNINPLPSIVALIGIISLETNVFGVADKPSATDGYLYAKPSICFIFFLWLRIKHQADLFWLPWFAPNFPSLDHRKAYIQLRLATGI